MDIMDLWFDSTYEGETCGVPGRFWNLVDLVATLVQIVASILVLRHTVAKDEHPQELLLTLVIGYTLACVAMVPILSWRFHLFNQYPCEPTPYTALASDEENNIQDIVNEYSKKRIKKVMDYSKIALELFFVGWFWVHVWFFYDSSSPDYGSRLYRLSMGFSAFCFFRYCIYLITCVAFPFIVCGVLVMQTTILITEAIKALYACIFRSNDVDSEWDGEDINCCCICLGKYGEKEEEQIRSLPCSHVFHLDCIEMWLRIKPTCPLCQSLINMSPTHLDTCA